MLKEKILGRPKNNNTNIKYVYRANNFNTKIKTKNGRDVIASNTYKGAPVKYFTLTEKELNAYTKKNTTYKKTWEVTDTIRLVDILDLETRKELAKKFNRIQVSALNTAFPVEENVVSRNSVNVDIDNIVLKALCELKYDGYYMDTIKAFHSEVGLCPSAYSKLKLVKSEPKKEAPTLKRKGNNNERVGRNRTRRLNGPSRNLSSLFSATI